MDVLRKTYRFLLVKFQSRQRSILSKKIFGFSGDQTQIEGTYAAIKIACNTITEILYGRIKEGYFDFNEAVELAERILAKNPEEVYIEGVK